MRNFRFCTQTEHGVVEVQVGHQADVDELITNIDELFKPCRFNPLIQ